MYHTDSPTSYLDVGTCHYQPPLSIRWHIVKDERCGWFTKSIFFYHTSQEWKRFCQSTSTFIKFCEKCFLLSVLQMAFKVNILQQRMAIDVNWHIAHCRFNVKDTSIRWRKSHSYNLNSI